MLMLSLVACSGAPTDDHGDSGGTEDLDPTALTGATGHTAITGSTAETGAPTPPEGWVLRTLSDFADASDVSIGVASNAADTTFVIGVERTGEFELWLHRGEWWRDGRPPVQVIGPGESTGPFVPSIWARDGVTHLLARRRCDRHYTTCPVPGAMKLVEIEIPDGWDGTSALVERPVTPADAIEDGASHLIEAGTELRVCHTVHVVGDEIECRGREPTANAWSPAWRVSEGVAGADDHPFALITSMGHPLVAHTTSQTGTRTVRLVLDAGADVHLGMDLKTGTVLAESDWLRLAEEQDGTWLAVWVQAMPTRQLVVGRCGAATPTGCASLGAWQREVLAAEPAASQNHPDLEVLSDTALVAWESADPKVGQRIRLGTACASGDVVVDEPDPEGEQTKRNGFPGMAYEPDTDTVHLAYKRDRGAGGELVWASLYDPSGACP